MGLIFTSILVQPGLKGDPENITSPFQPQHRVKVTSETVHHRALKEFGKVNFNLITLLCWPK